MHVLKGSAVFALDTCSDQRSCVYPLYVLPHQQLCLPFVHVVWCNGYSLRSQTHKKEKTDATLAWKGSKPKLCQSSPSGELEHLSYIHCTTPHTHLFEDLYQERPGLCDGS